MTESIAAMYSMTLWNERQKSAGRESDFWNYGYWDANTRDASGASQQLLDHLQSKFPTRGGQVLDVAFGKGESTRQLCARFGADNVIGINIASDQLEAARMRGVGCDLRVMDAAQMRFRDSMFDVILCVEAAFHFRTRARFLERARAALRPNGRLIMSDILFRSGHGLPTEIFPTENVVHSIEEYRAHFAEAGFIEADLQIERTMERQVVPYFLNLARAMRIWPHGNSQTVTQGAAKEDMWAIHFMLTRLLNILDCVVVVATKR